MAENPKRQRVVTVHIAIECLVDGGQATESEVGQVVLNHLDATGMVVNGSHVRPRGYGLIRTHDRVINPRESNAS